MTDPNQLPDAVASGSALPAVGSASNGQRTARADDLAAAVAGLADSEQDLAGRRRLLGRLMGGLKDRGVKELFQPRKAIGWITDAVADLAPHVPVRTLQTLQQHFPGLDGEALAERLIRNAARATAGVGAVGGGVASIEWAAPPTLLTTPVLLATETVAVVAIELKLVGELHEIYGHPIAGTGTQRAIGLLQAWAGHRGVTPPGAEVLAGGLGRELVGTGVATVLGTATRKQLRDMLVKRFGRSLTSLGPLLTGAAVASYLNRRFTRKLGEEVQRDLRRRYGRQLEIEG